MNGARGGTTQARPACFLCPSLWGSHASTPCLSFPSCRVAGNAVSPPRHARARLWVGVCPKASACQQTLRGPG